jgi:hypothetical protein
MSICILFIAFTAVAEAVEPGWVVINEIMYDPPLGGQDYTDEWIELFNITTQTISLNGWTISDGEAGGTHTFGDLSISGRGYLLLEYEEAAATPTADDIYGDDATNLKLANTGDDITLKDNSGTTIDTVTYSPGWGGNGNGKSLERKNPWGTSNDSNNWTSSTDDGGTPKAQNNAYNPTAVTLSSLTATFDASKGVLIRWTVESALNNVGWNIYRSETKEGEYVKLNDTLIPNAEDATSRHSYEYIDKTALPGKRYYYYIEDVDFDGKKTMSPIVVVNGGQSVRAKKNLATTWAKIKRGS